MVDALIPVAVLIVSIATTVLLFGTDATGGPLQVALLISAVAAALVAFKNGFSVGHVRDAAVGGISSGMSALFILLAVGALIGTWNMAGTIPTIVYYGLGLLTATWFYPATAVVCGLVGLAIGSSWTTAATLGVAFVALAPLVGADPVITAGAVISGAYFGDKLTPVSETTVLVPSMVGGVTTNQHIGAMLWTSGPSVVIALVLFTILGFATPASGPGFDTAAAQATLAGEFNISLFNLLPLALLVVLSIRRFPPFLAIFSSAIFAALLSWFTQPELVAAFVDRPDLGPLATGIAGLFMAMANGFVSVTGNETIDALFSRGGMSSMLFTIWLILGALAFAAIMEEAGFLERFDSAGRCGGQEHRAPHCLGHRDLHRPQHRRRRPVRRHRHAQPDLPRRIRAERHCPTDALACSRGLRNRHVAARPVEQLRRVHGRSARRRHNRLSAVLLLQSGQPDHLPGLRLHRVPH